MELTNGDFASHDIQQRRDETLGCQDRLVAKIEAIGGEMYAIKEERARNTNAEARELGNLHCMSGHEVTISYNWLLSLGTRVMPNREAPYDVY